MEDKFFKIPIKIKTALEDLKMNTISQIGALNENDFESLNEVLIKKGKSQMSLAEKKLVLNLRDQVRKSEQVLNDEMKKEIKKLFTPKIVVTEADLPGLREKLYMNLKKCAFKFHKEESLKLPTLKLVGDKLIAKCCCPECGCEM